MLPHLNRWFFGLPQRRQSLFLGFLIVVALLLLEQVGAFQYLMMIFWMAYFLFWIGALLFVILGLVGAGLGASISRMSAWQNFKK